ncbi:hypothetical protein QVD17_37948 [Tagetes erecta]|uniref:Uncharacterized protein n=1 Tax=Tagetes erecta TaxID=13708 RepID=A0AAD8K1I1_TARER|nr:hypothetical protein QVD17_37948 [Tagetes erecta]
MVHSDSQSPRNQEFVFSRIDFAIQKGIAAQLVARLPIIRMFDHLLVDDDDGLNGCGGGGGGGGDDGDSETIFGIRRDFAEIGGMFRNDDGGVG